MDCGVGLPGSNNHMVHIGFGSLADLCVHACLYHSLSLVSCACIFCPKGHNVEPEHRGVIKPVASWSDSFVLI